MRDGIDLARRGIPVVALVTTEFVAQADFVARAAGMPEVPRVVLPHPVAGSGAVAIASAASGAAPLVVARLRAEP